jgi:hypothetical protein
MALHHVNGVGQDDRLENLQMLCPDCHSQTENFAGRNRRRDGDLPTSTPSAAFPGQDHEGGERMFKGTRVAAVAVAAALAAVPAAGCGEEDVESGAKDVEQGAKSVGNEARDEGGEVKRDVEKEVKD